MLESRVSGRSVLGSVLLASLLVASSVSAQPAREPEAAEPAAEATEGEGVEAPVAASEAAPTPEPEPEPEPEPQPVEAVEAPEVGPAPAVASATVGTAQPVQLADAEKPPWEKKPKVRARGQVRALYTVTDHPDQPNHQFGVQSARLELKWTQGKLLEAVLEGELADEDRNFDARSLLRDAYVRVKAWRELKLRAGQFKRPFSRLELESRRSLRLVERGLANEWIVEHLGYGDRDIGLQIEGRFGRDTGLSYAVGVFNGSGKNREDDDPAGSKDWVARIETEPVSWLSFGLNASYKWFDGSRALYPKSALMGGADFQVKLEGLHLLGEGLYGENYLLVEQEPAADEVARDASRLPSLGALLLVSYEIPLTPVWQLVLEPLAKGEILKQRADLRDGHSWMATVGTNLHVGEYFRLMAQGEMIRNAPNVPDTWQTEERRLFVQAVMSTR